MNANDEVRLRHMLDAARTAMRLAQGRTRDHLEEDEALALSLTKAIEMIGEAASRVSEPAREEAPSIPWAQIIAMRNRLVHAYFDIDLEVLWRTVRGDLPALVTQLESIVTTDADWRP